MCQLTGLWYFDVRNNSLIGSIPQNIGNCTTFQVLDLSYNQLTGEIPFNIGFLQVATLSLQGNQLSGQIPSVIRLMQALAVLDLSCNMLNGPIPPILGNLTYMEKLYLHGNKLTEPIPPELGNMTKLHYLYTALVEQNVLQAAKNMEKVLDVSLSQIAEDSEFPPNPPPPFYPFFSKEFFHRHGRDLFSCAAAWFLVDIVFYSTNLVQTQINDKQFKDKLKVNVYEDAFNVAKFQAMVTLCSTIPGYWATVFLIDRIGRVRIQMIGFSFMALALFAIGIPYSNYWYKNTKNVGFLILYGLTFFFSNFGPNTTTFIVPAELFPARFRSTCHGISGPFGKVGAIIGSVGFLWATKKNKNGEYDPTLMTIALVLLGRF